MGRGGRCSGFGPGFIAISNAECARAGRVVLSRERQAAARGAAPVRILGRSRSGVCLRVLSALRTLCATRRRQRRRGSRRQCRPMGTLYLVRHGQASFGADDYDQLSELGHRQCVRLGEYFRDSGRRFDAVLTGTLKRQRAVARGHRRRHAVDAASRCSWPGLNEYDSEAVIAAVHPQPLARPETPEHVPAPLPPAARGPAAAGWPGSAAPAGMPSYAEFVAGVNGALDHVRGDAPGRRADRLQRRPDLDRASARFSARAPETTIELNMRIRNSSVTEFAFTPKRHVLVTTTRCRTWISRSTRAGSPSPEPDARRPAQGCAAGARHAARARATSPGPWRPTFPTLAPAIAARLHGLQHEPRPCDLADPPRLHAAGRVRRGAAGRLQGVDGHLPRTPPRCVRATGRRRPATPTACTARRPRSRSRSASPRSKAARTRCCCRAAWRRSRWSTWRC